MAKRLSNVLTIFCLFFLIIFSMTRTVLADDLSVTVRVGTTTVTFSGKTSPNALVTFIENGAVVGTTQANSDGNFTKSLIYFVEGEYTIGIYAVDSGSITTSTVSNTISLTIGHDTSVENIILPPTIGLSESAVTAGETLNISGEATVASTINLFFSNGNTGQASSSATGTWQYSYSTSNLSAGGYNVYAKVNTDSGYQSKASETKSFIVKTAPTPTPTNVVAGPTATSTPGTIATPTLAQVITATPPPAGFLQKVVELVIPDTLETFDVNDSGVIELSELYEVVEKWVNSWRGDKEVAVCDIDSDGKCNIVDFSILMYYVDRRTL